MSCHGWNDRLDLIVLVKVVSDAPRGLKTVHLGHVAVHKDQAEFASAVGFQVISDDVQGLLSWESCFAVGVRVKTDVVFKDNLQSLDVKRLVVYD